MDTREDYDDTNCVTNIVGPKADTHPVSDSQGNPTPHLYVLTSTQTLQPQRTEVDANVDYDDNYCITNTGGSKSDTHPVSDSLGNRTPHLNVQAPTTTTYSGYVQHARLGASSYETPNKQGENSYIHPITNISTQNDDYYVDPNSANSTGYLEPLKTNAAIYLEPVADRYSSYLNPVNSTSAGAGADIHVESTDGGSIYDAINATGIASTRDGYSVLEAHDKRDFRSLAEINLKQQQEQTTLPTHQTLLTDGVHTSQTAGGSQTRLTPTGVENTTAPPVQFINHDGKPKSGTYNILVVVSVIFASLFCWVFPFGITGCVLAIQANSRSKEGNADVARKISYVSIVFLVLTFISAITVILVPVLMITNRFK